ncbi:tetratricopeptide repeat protein [Pseudoruegeria sp. HB172150]|uniref:tetratricopeptide repeat protein n=1 Tax=Pseudoruegeria sp. HB172150 TaxID=2721164 RepID=UPI001555D2E0|nr:tetratricopeptide repeat protein [Pseudoruegeria sp. HB172150]
MLRLIATVFVTVTLFTAPLAAQEGIDEELAQIKAALESIESKAEGGDPHAAFVMASLYHIGIFVAADRPKAIGYLKASSEGGDPDGMYYLALHMIHGVDMERDVEGAKALFQQAADAGHAPGQLAMDVYLSE